MVLHQEFFKYFFLMHISLVTHTLNLVLVQGTKNIQYAKIFFATLDCFHNFLLYHPKGPRIPGVCEGPQCLNIVFD